MRSPIAAANESVARASCFSEVAASRPPAWAVSSAVGLDAGFAAGLLSGALTESPAMGTASEAIAALPLSADERQLLVERSAHGRQALEPPGSAGIGEGLHGGDIGRFAAAEHGHIESACSSQRVTL